jgi:hypothetical protein
MEKASSGMKSDLRSIDRKSKALEADAKKYIKQVAESETLKKALQEKLESNITTLLLLLSSLILLPIT